MIAADEKRVILALKRMDHVLNQLPQLSLSWLSAEERDRYGSFSTGTRREQFLCGRFLAREAISYMRGGGWHTYFLSAPEAGPPRILWLNEPEKMDSLSISISHTDGWVACAVSNSSVGVDVQSRHKPRDIVGLSQMIDCDLSLEVDPSTIKLDRLFYAHWGLREAWIKQSAAAPGVAAPRFVPNQTEDDGRDGLVSDIGGATLVLYPARPQAIDMTPGSFPVPDWTRWRPWHETLANV